MGPVLNGKKKIMILILFGIYIYKLINFYDIKIDDAFIFHRISFNLIHYHSFSYNLETVGAMATTSLVHPLINAPLLIIFDHSTFPNVVNFVTSLYILISIFVLYKLYQKIGDTYNWFYLSLLLIGTNVYYLVLGMETTLQMLFVLVYSYIFTIWSSERRYYLLGVLISLSYFIRPDLLLLLFASSIVLILLNKKIIPKEILKISSSTAISFVIVLLLNKTLTNSYLPSTLGTKLIQGEMNLFGTFSDKLLLNPLPNLTNIAPLAFLFVSLALLGFIVLAYDTFKFKKKEAIFFLTIVLYGFAHAITYSIIGISYYHWYFVPFTIGVIFSLFYLISSRVIIFIKIVCSLLQRDSNGFVIKKFSNIFILVFIVITLIISNTLIDPPVMPWNGDIGDMYKQIGLSLKELGPNNSVFVGEAGIIGYYACGVDILDYFGVIYPKILTYNSTNWEESLNIWLHEETPKYVVIWYPPPSNFLMQNYRIIKDFHAESENWHYAVYELKEPINK